MGGVSVPVLDTTFLIDLQRGRERALHVLEAMLDAEEDLVVPAQVAVEFLSGVKDQAVALRRLEAAFTFAPADRDHALVAAELAREARARGAFPGWSDVNVAAHARLESTYVVTANAKHFREMGCDHWDYTKAEAPRTYGLTP